MINLRIVGSSLCLSVLIGVAAQAQTAESPVYKSWAQVPVGTRMIQKTVSVGSDGSTVESKTIQTLQSIDDDVATVEQIYVDPQGEEFTQVFRHRRKVLLLPGVKAENLGIPANATDQGAETLQIAGREFETKWYDTTGQAEAGTMLIRTWYSNKVPGLIVKSFTRIEGFPSTTTIELVDLIRPGS
ncbi:hypothetical protein [Tautonia marina]|uniref:hypothetical protein n=1 Tax=Tautonia marina TaxID=2653855 RepID=UPI001260E3D9|nr:hypothetical protein [Tautonia marina]